MKEPTLNIAPSEDRRAVRLAFAADEARVVMTVTPAEVDAMIGGLAAARASLIPPIPTGHVSAPCHGPVRMQAVVPADPIDGKRLLLFRHPGFGWLAFAYEPADGEGLAAGLSAAIAADRGTAP